MNTSYTLEDDGLEPPEDFILRVYAAEVGPPSEDTVARTYNVISNHEDEDEDDLYFCDLVPEVEEIFNPTNDPTGHFREVADEIVNAIWPHCR